MNIFRTVAVLLGGAAFALLPLKASAQITTSTTQTFTLPTTSLSLNQTFSFNKFDTTLGTLTGISFVIENVVVNDSVYFVANNDGDYTVTEGATVSVLSSGASPVTFVKTVPTTTDSVWLNKGDTYSQSLQATGGATVTYDSNGNCVSATGDGVSSAQQIVVSDFVGLGSFTFTLRGSNYESISGAGFSGGNTTATASATVKVVYNYTTPAPSVPEPSTWVMLIGGIGGVVLMRRVSRKQA